MRCRSRDRPGIRQIHAHLPDADAIVDDGVRSRLAALKGVPLVVNQWASWCPSCRVEFPFFRELADGYRERVAFLGLNSRDERGGGRGVPAPELARLSERLRRGRLPGAIDRRGRELADDRVLRPARRCGADQARRLRAVILVSA